VQSPWGKKEEGKKEEEKKEEGRVMRMEGVSTKSTSSAMY
jgi:hypothetical protein